MCQNWPFCRLSNAAARLLAYLLQQAMVPEDGRRWTLSQSSRRETTPQLATIALFRWHRSLRRWWNTSSARKWCVISTSMTFFTMLNMASGKDVHVRHSSYLVPTTSWRHSTRTFRQMPSCWTFRKRFDRVAHTHLLKKLEAIGVTGTTLGWISSFLTDREQTVVLEGMSSDSKPVTSGVPQGTVLGPLLFLIYINDLPNCVNSSTIRLFADDCLIYKEIHSQQDTEDLQADLDADLGASVADEFSFPEVSTTVNHTEAISNHRPVQHPRACIGGGWHSKVPWSDSPQALCMVGAHQPDSQEGQ